MPADGKARQTDKSGIWEIDVYTKNKEGKYTKNDLHIRRPAEAGSLMVIKATLTDDGRVLCDDPEIGVSVELDWKPGEVTTWRFRHPGKGVPPHDAPFYQD